MIDPSPTVSSGKAHQLQIVAYAMAGSLIMLGCFAISFHLGARGRVPGVEQVRFINLLTIIVMATAFIGILGSELLWRRLVSKKPNEEGVVGAFIVRLALREASGLMGLTALLLAAMGGVLHIYPAYWVNAVPALLFVSFMATHWPAPDRLNDEVDSILRETSGVQAKNALK